jgi:hypothetical protein
MDQIVRYIYRNTTYFTDIKTDGLPARNEGHEHRVGRLLYKMNCDAYYLRYPGEKVARAPEGERIEDLYTWKWREECSQIQMYKHLHFFLYQCNESDELASRPEYKELNELFYRLGRHIVEHLPEYDAAKWN